MNITFSRTSTGRISWKLETGLHRTIEDIYDVAKQLDTLRDELDSKPEPQWVVAHDEDLSYLDADEPPC